MQKIGIDTGHTIPNYGTKLQAYSMQYILNKYADDTQIFEVYKLPNSIIEKHIKKTIYFLLSLKCLNPFKLILTYIKRNKGNYKFRLLWKTLRRYYFINKIDASYNLEYIIGTKDELSQRTSTYTHIFCGSDQAWVPSNIKLDIYTLSYVNRNVKKCAYAPSFGVEKIDDNIKKEYKNFLQDFEAISVRETAGAKIIQDLLNKNVPVVLDPTMLVGRELWDNVIEESLSKKYGDYILVYLLGDNKEHRLFCNSISKLLKLKILYFPHFIKYNDKDNLIEGQELWNVDPFQFIGLIKNAKFIITDSFHCTAFAMQYHKQFYVVSRFSSNSNNSTNSRISTLLDHFNLKSRLVTNFSEILNTDEMVDYSSFEEILHDKQSFSYSFLDNIFSNNQ